MTTKQINRREVYMFVKAIKQVEAMEEKGWIASKIALQS